MALELSLDLTTSMTWGDLIAFVDAARTSVKPTDHVDIVTLENETDWVPDRLRVELAVVVPAPTVIDKERARLFRSTLQAVIDNEGDARRELTDLEEIRDALG